MPRSPMAQVEHQMRLQEILEKVADGAVPSPTGARFGPFVAVSREAGSGGAEIGRRLATRLGWTVYDKELVDGVAESLHLSPRFVQLLDEARTDWFREAILELIDSRVIHQEVYVERLSRVMLLAACEGRAVFVGRGAHLLLPPETGLRVRVVASRPFRAARVAELEGLDQHAALRRIDEVDEDRADYLKRGFRGAGDEAFDVVLDAERLGFDGAVEVILAGLRARGLLAP